MKYILNADDFGFTKDSTKTTIDLLNKGYLSSATIMCNCESTSEAIRFAKSNPEFSFGVHLTFIDGIEPLYSKKTSLCKNGKFLYTRELYIKSLLGLINLEDVVNEIKSQISILTDNGIKVSHIDSHGNVHKLPVFQRALETALPNFDINKVRREQNIFKNQVKDSYIKKQINNYFTKKKSKIFKETDYFYMPAHSYDGEWTEFLLTTLNSLKQEKVIEIAVHPGTEEYYRTFEYKEILSFNNKIKDTNHQMITYNGLL